MVALDPDAVLEDRLRVRIRTEGGIVVDFVIQYEAMIEGSFYPVERYDGSHGRGHRDLVDRHGETVRKDWLPDGPGLDKGLNVGIQDLTERWRSYRAAFLAREPEGRRHR